MRSGSWVLVFTFDLMFRLVPGTDLLGGQFWGGGSSEGNPGPRVHLLPLWFGGPPLCALLLCRETPPPPPLHPARSGTAQSNSSGTMRPAAFGQKGYFLWFGGQEGGGGGWQWRAPREGGRQLGGKQQAGKVRPESWGLSGAPVRGLPLGCIISCHFSISLRQASQVQMEH